MSHTSQVTDTTAPNVQAPLRPVTTRPPLGEYLAQLWRRRHFIAADSRARALSNNRDMVLGNVWLLARPVLDGLVYYVIFALILQVDRGMANYTGFLIIGIFMFRFTSAVTNASITCMPAARPMTQAFVFPRASIPLAVVMRETISMAPVLSMMFLLLLVLPPGTSVTATWLLMPVVFALQVLVVTGVSLYTARFGSVVPDLKHLMSFMVRLWFYGSGVMFPIERFVSDHFWMAVLRYNPMYCVLDMTRDLLLYDQVPTLRVWMILTLWAVLTPLLGFLFFWQGEETYAED